MSFFKKSGFFIAVLIILMLLQFYAPNIGTIKINILQHEIQSDIYILILFISTLLFLLFLLRRFIAAIQKLFLKEHKNNDALYIKSIAEIIVGNKKIETTPISQKYQDIKTAIIISQGTCPSSLPTTNNPSIDIFILKARLKKCIDETDSLKSIEIAQEIIKNHKDFINIARKEILECAVLAKKCGISFSFDPRKYKYNLPASFISLYFISLELLDFEIEENFEKKLKILEKIHKNHPKNYDICIKLLNFANDQYNDKKTIETIKRTFEYFPNRNFAFFLIKLKRNDIFEIAQNISSTIKDTNIEKLWFLLLISVHMEFMQKSKEIIEKIAEADPSDDILKFYIKHHNIFHDNKDIHNIIRKKIQ